MNAWKLMYVRLPEVVNIKEKFWYIQQTLSVSERNYRTSGRSFYLQEVIVRVAEVIIIAEKLSTLLKSYRSYVRNYQGLEEIFIRLAKVTNVCRNLVHVWQRPSRHERNKQRLREVTVCLAEVINVWMKFLYIWQKLSTSRRSYRTFGRNYQYLRGVNNVRDKVW